MNPSTPSPAGAPSLAGPPEKVHAGAVSWMVVATVIAVAAIFGLTYGLVAPMVAHDLHARGCSERLIGLNAAMHAVGVLLIAGWLPRLAVACGTRQLMLAALILAAGLLSAFALTSAIWAWFVLRFGLGVAAEVLFVCSETWINQLSNDGNRGRIMAIYTASLALGFAGGPIILSMSGTGGTSFLIGAAIAVVAGIPLLHPRMIAPVVIPAAIRRPLATLRLAPVALSTAFLNAGVETAGLSFIALYATNMQWSEAAGMRLISTLLVGAILMQVPIGWLADRMDRRRLVIILAALSTAGALVWPLLFSMPWLAFAVVFLWGGVFVGIYAVTLAMVGDRFAGGDLVAIYAALSIAWGIGALFGPSLIGLAMEASPYYGLPAGIAASCAAFTVFAAWRRGAH